MLRDDSHPGLHPKEIRKNFCSFRMQRKTLPLPPSLLDLRWIIKKLLKMRSQRHPDSSLRATPSWGEAPSFSGLEFLHQESLK